MDSPLQVAALVAGALLLIALVAVAVVAFRRQAIRQQDVDELEALLAHAHSETDDLRRQLDELTALVQRFGAPTDQPARNGGDVEFLITDAGTRTEPVVVADRVVLSAAFGEPALRVVAFGHGVRRALSAESRNRIRFEMKREVRAARKRRRRMVRDHLREARARDRAAEGGL